MAHLTLKQLRAFEALARHGHFGRAAQACAITQPALSMQIKGLEDMLGTVLFERTARGVRLTGLGEDLAGRVREILRAVDDLGDLARAAKTTFVGRLRLGVIPTVAPYLVPTIVADLARAYPTLDVHIRETLTPRLIEDLAWGRLDAAIVALPICEPWLTEDALFHEHMVLVRPRADAHKPVPDRDGLRRLRLLLLEEGHCFRDQALSFCNLGSAAPREGLDGSSLSTLVQMVGVGLGVTLIPEMAVAVETRSAPVAVARFAAPEPTRTIGLVWRATSPLASRLRQVGEGVRQSAQSLRTTALSAAGPPSEAAACGSEPVGRPAGPRRSRKRLSS